MKVDIFSRELIKPSSPTPSDLKDFKLSFIDQQIPPSYVPLILYYSYNESSNITQSDMSYRLKKSLSDALTRFYPLAGRMKGESSVDCNDEGVYYLEARVDGRLSDIIDCPEAEALDQFLPYEIDATGFNVVEQLAIQVNLFDCGGIVIGVCFSHRIADAFALCTFIKGWATIARGESNLVCPIFNLASLFPPRDPSDLKLVARNPSLKTPLVRLVTKRFVFAASAISALRSELVNSSSTVQPTRVEVVSALVWKCGVAATGQEKSRASGVTHPVNLRGKMIPSVQLPEYSLGNLFQMVSTVTNGETDLSSLVGKLRSAFGKIDGNYIEKLLGEHGFEVCKNNFMDLGKLLSQQGDVQLFRFSSMCRFPSNEADFGWGKPTWVSSASFPTKNHVFLMDSRWAGGIEAWVVMDEQTMANFEENPELQAFISSFPGN